MRHGKLFGVTSAPLNLASIGAVIFDKDGTLVDFHKTWDAAVGRTLEALSGQQVTAPADHNRELRAAADVLGYDLTSGTILPGSPVIAESNAHLIALAEPILGDLTASLLGADRSFAEHFNSVGIKMAAESVAEADGATALLHFLYARDIPMAVATNDSEAAARSQIEMLGWAELFGGVVGYDSGYGAKPEPGMVLGAAELLEIAPDSCLMVGDSSHDIDAGTAAGTATALIANQPSSNWGPRHLGLRNLSELHDYFLADLG